MLFHKYAEDILQSGMLTLGKYTAQLEAQCSHIIGSRTAIAVNSGTSAIEIALRSLKITNSEVIVPTNTFSASAAAAILAGNKVRFVDIDPKTLCASRTTIEDSVTSATRAIILVHTAGIISPDTTKISEFCEKKGIKLIEDAAHAFGSKYQGRSAGTFGVAGCFSFYPTKVVTSGEGGLIVSDSPEIDTNARVLRDQGKESFNSNTVVKIGYNWRMSEFNAACGVITTRRIDEIVNRRNRIATIYNEILHREKRIEVIDTPIGCLNNYYKYVVLLQRGINREQFKKEMKSQKSISCSGEVYSPPLHLQPVYMNLLGTKKGDYPTAEDVCERMVCLPMYQTLDNKSAQYVAESISEVIDSVNSK